ncbi:MAG: hypothetical protein ACOY0T_40995 [Myxococcota bacterium]
MMRWLRERWHAFWFTPEAPDNLGLCRLLFYGLIFLLYLDTSWSEWSEVSRVFWEPISLFKHLRLPVFSAGTLTVLGLLWKVSLLASALGVLTRLSTTVAFGIGTYLLGLPHNFSKTHHFDAMLVLVLGLLMLARTGDAYALDSTLFKKRPSREPSGEYRWPVRATWVVMSLVFFSAGISKLRHGGLAWMFSENMAVVLLQHGYSVASHEPLSRIGLWFAQYPKLCSVLAFLTVVVEALYPLALVSRHARWIFPPGMCAALIGIRLMMGPTFPQFVICHLFWVPWDRVAELVAKRWRAAPAAVL